MQGWMIAMIVVAGVIVVVAVALLSIMLVFVHNVLGRRTKRDENIPDKYCVDTKWFTRLDKLDRMQSLSVTAYDGIKLGATLIKQPDKPSLVAICCHGYNCDMRFVQPQAKIFYDRGFDVVLPAMRGHVGSEGKIGMAWVDRFDLLRWIDKIVSMYGDTVRIALFGVSMGGSTVIAAAGMNPPPQVKCVIDDCGFSSQYDQSFSSLKHAGLPKFFIHFYNSGLKLVHGYSLQDADFVPFAKKMTVPALFFHGEDDKFVPFALGQKLFDACGSAEKKFIAVPGAEHACSYSKDKDGYVAALTEFVDAHILGSHPVEHPELEAEEEPEEAPEQEQTSAEEVAENPAEQTPAESSADNAAETVAEEVEKTAAGEPVEKPAEEVAENPAEEAK